MATQSEFAEATQSFYRRLKVFETHLKTYGIRFRRTCTLRTNADQALLYTIGRTRPGRIVTYARPGQSPHNHMLAADYAIIFNGKCDWNPRSKRWTLFGILARSSCLEWGGDFKNIKDCPHVQYPSWRKYIVRG